MHNARSRWRSFIIRLSIVAIAVSAIYGFFTLCVKTPFPSVHTLDFLSVIVNPYLNLGENIYQKGREYSLQLAFIAGLMGIVLSFVLVIKKVNRELSRIAILMGFTIGVVAELLFVHSPNSLSYYMLTAAIVLVFIGSLRGGAQDLKAAIQPPGRRARSLLVVLLLLVGLLFRAYHLDIKPPGHAHHTAETGMISAKLAHEMPWSLTSMTQFKESFKKAVSIMMNEPDGGTGIPIILDWICFNIWESHYILERGVSVVLGVLSIYILFLIAEELFGTWTGLLAGFFMAVCPWNNAHSRYSQAVFTVALILIVLSVYLVLKALRLRSLKWNVFAILAIVLDFFAYPTTQFIVFVVIVFWIYYTILQRERWRSYLIAGLLSLAIVALIIAPKTRLFGPVNRIKLINSFINERTDYSIQPIQVIKVNVAKLAKSFSFQVTDNDCWYRKEGGILVWPLSVAFLCGLAWCLPRLRDFRCMLLLIWVGIGVSTTIPSPNVLPRRMICANPAIYIVCAVFMMLVLTTLKPLIPKRLKIIPVILLLAVMIVFSSASFATFYYHTLMYEEFIHGGDRRIAEIVYGNIQDYYIYLDYKPHEHIESIWVYCAKYLEPGQKDLPLTFFQVDEFPNKILPALRTGRLGAMFIVPDTREGNDLIYSLETRFPGGERESYKVDPDFFDHSKGNPLCQTYKISKEDLAKYKSSVSPITPKNASEIKEITPEKKFDKSEGILPVAAGQMIAGRCGAGPGEYNEPRGIALDYKGNIYVADFRNFRIQKFDHQGIFVTAWGEVGDYPGQFKDACGVAVDRDGRVYVADTFNSRVQVFKANGKLLFHFQGGLYVPRGIAVDGEGRIWVADTGNGVVRVFSKDGNPLKVIGRRGQGKAEFDTPNSLAIDQKQKVYVADSGNKRVQILDKEGNYLEEFKVDGWQQGTYNEPYLDVDSRGEIYLTDPAGHRALKYSRKGKLLGILEPMEGSEPLLLFPMGIAVEPKGEAVYIVDCRRHRIHKFSKGDFK